MSTDPALAVDLLLPLYEAYKATAYSSLFVGIVFGEPQVKHFKNPQTFNVQLGPQAHMSSFTAHRSTSFCKYHSCPARLVLMDGSILSRRNGSGILRSIPRLFMLIITSAMFILGLVTIVLKTSLEYQQFTRFFSQPGGSPWPIHSISIITAVSAATSCVIVRTIFSFESCAHSPPADGSKVYP
jgi:hypothetical protein